MLKDFLVVPRKQYRKLVERRVLELAWAYVCGLLTVALVWAAAMLEAVWR